jgi:uncharacterized protein (DUF486 family)
MANSPIWYAILVSWGIAFFEYLFQVPANRFGFMQLSLPQLKILQEVITLGVFAAYAILYMKVEMKMNFVYAGLCLVGATFFVFRDGLPT